MAFIFKGSATSTRIWRPTSARMSPSATTPKLMLVIDGSRSTSFLFRLQHPFAGVFSPEEWCGEYVGSAGKNMLTATSLTQRLKMPSQIRRVRGQVGDLYELIFLDQQDRIIVPL